MEEAIPAAAKKVHALALTGGGYRGLFTARILERFEQAAAKPVGQCFDLIAGTSIGGILSLAIAFEIPMATVVRTMTDHGKVLFKPKCRLSGVLRSKHDVAGLRELIRSMFPDGATLGDAKHAVAIPTINLSEGRQQVFKTRHNPEWIRDSKYSVLDVALATAAAPIYFPIARFGGQLFADGGLVANAPDLVALHETHKFFNVPDENVRMLSIGTLSSNYAIRSSSKLHRGLIHWLKVPSLPLINTILSAQEQFAIQMVKHRLRARYMRLDETPPDAVMEIVGLDVATSEATTELIRLADIVFERVASTEEFALYYQHSPARWIV